MLGFGLYMNRWMIFDGVTDVKRKFMIWGIKLIDGDLFGVDGEVLVYGFNNSLKIKA